VIRAAARWLWREFELLVRVVVWIVALGALQALLGCAADVEAFPDESVCVREAEARNAECATVYEFAMLATPFRHVELCVPERYLADAERRHGPSWPSDHERFTRVTQGLVDPLCFWACPGIVGANAFNGSWVPDGGCP
jgi:hypothetical protein